MHNDDLDKSLNDAMGNVPEQEQPPAEPKPTTRSKASLRTPPLVAAKDEPKISEPVPESIEELKLRLKVEILQELLAEQHKVRATGKAIAAEMQEKAEPEEMVNFTINLPVQASNIRLDGREYYHGHTYSIKASQLSTFRDIQANAWRHDDQVRGYRPHAAGASTSGIHINREGQALTIPV